MQEGVWKLIIPSAFFAEYNPYKDSINGDWFLNKGRLHHTGEVFLNGKSLYEKETLEKVLHPIAENNIIDPLGSTYTWYCESDEKSTTIYANFHESDPNKQLVEISARRTVFYPEKPGINFITQWAAPTAEQIGMIATNWNKGWIIENNTISDSKCNGITLGKERGTGHNVWSADKGNVNRDGNIHYIEVVFNVLRNGWDQAHIGSHIVRNNTIFNCEQTGICGSMGAVFSVIENNHIYNIWQKRQFEGWEIGGVKFHAPIDVIIRKNNIHDCGRGIWLDWMTQGTRVTGNLLYNNDKQDLFVEVNHGPYIIDNNIFLSPIAISNMSEGGAYLHNIFQGMVVVKNELNRFTPYFLPHSTSIAGLTTIYGGDDRFYNNIFIGNGDNSNNKYGLEVYNNIKLPVWISGNVYYNQSKPSNKDSNDVIVNLYDPAIKLVVESSGTFLNISFDQTLLNHKGDILTTASLGRAKISKAAFENSDGSPLKIDTDYFGKKRMGKNSFAGPFAAWENGNTKLKVW
jgi:hypothetical protein